MNHTIWGRICVVFLVLELIASSAVPAFAEKGSPGTDVQQLANRVRKVIKLVEENPTISCEMRNHLVKRLRTLDDALESGNRSAARAMVIAWTDEARSYQSAGLLSAAQGSILHNGLQGLVEKIGIGAPEKPGPTRKWEPLPACDSGETTLIVSELAGAAMVGAYNPWDPNDAKDIARMFAGMVPAIGPLLSCMVAVFWPASGDDVSALIDQELDDYTVLRVTDTLSGLKDGLSPYDGYQKVRDAWLKDCAGVESNVCNQGAQNVWSAWDDMRTEFVTARKEFQTDDPDNQLMLLPLFAQYETLYLSFLNEGILLAPSWIASGGVTPSQAAIPADIMAQELDPNFVDPQSDFVDPVTSEKNPDRGIGYVNLVYGRGLVAQGIPANWKQWTERNRWVRDMTLQVLDFRDIWKFFDPVAYPQGVEGGPKLTRMIYSDPVGHLPNSDFATDFVPPPNVAGPLKELSFWSAAFDYGKEMGYGSHSGVISAVQATSPPTAGPARVGAITGDTTHDGPTQSYFLDLRLTGPITEAQVKTDKVNALAPLVPVEIGLKPAATDTWWYAGEGAGSAPVASFTYPGHVLATAKAMGLYRYSAYEEPTGWDYYADSVIFGFRLYDSFSPSGALVSVGSDKCMDVRSLSAGTQPTIYSCFSGGGPGQVWTYDAGTKAVTIGGGQLCLKGTGTSYGSAVVIDVCTGTKNEQWEFVPSADGLKGLIKSVESGLVLDVAGGATADRTPIVLWYSHGGTNQQWTLASQLRGEVHGIGSGRCLDVKSGDTANGTQVQIYDCNGTAAQAWTYDEGAQTLSVYNGTKCLNASGTTAGAALQIWDCSGAASQQWSFAQDRHITNVPTGLVLNVESGGMTNGSPVILWTRTTGAQQKWSRPSRLGGNVHATYAGKCLDLPNLSNGTQAQIFDCLAAPASGQEWTYHPLTKRFTVQGDGTEKCLSTQGAGPGAAVVVNDCIDDPNQLWTRKANGVGGTIVNANSGLCMTLPGTDIVTASGTKVQLQTCSDSSETANPNQQWIWP